MTPFEAILLSSLACGQAVFVVEPVAEPVVAAAGAPAAAKPASEDGAPRSIVFTVDNERFEGPVVSLKDGPLTIGSDPPKTLPLDQVERIELGTVDVPILTWIGQDNRDLVQTSAAAGTNGIQDIHLRCSGIASARSLAQVVITAVVGGAPQIWLLEPNNTPFWRLTNERTAGTDKADFYFEPPPADCFEQPLEVTLTYDDKRTVKSRVVATTHTDPKLKIVPAEKNDVKTPAAPGASVVFLVDDQSVRGQLSTIAKESLALKLSGGQQLDIPMSDVLGCWLGGDKSDQRKVFDERLKARGTSDWALIMGRDNAAATVEGNVHGVADGKLEFVVAEETRKVSLDRVLGVVLATHPPRPPSDAFCQTFELTGGDKLTGRLIAITLDALEIRSPWDTELKFARNEVRAITCRNGRATYLSDLEPATAEEVPYFTRRLPYRRDQNLLGDPLVLGGTTYRKGLAVHAKSVLTYALEGRFESFQARLGFDDGAPPGGSVACRILADDKELYANLDLRQDTEAVPLKLDVSGAKQLVLEVDFGRFADVGDRILWAGARVFRPTPKAEAVTPTAATPSAEPGAPAATAQPPSGNP